MIAIWSGGLDGLADAADVDSVAAAGSAWKTDVETLGPWRPGRLPGVAEPVWVGAGTGSPPWILLAGACSSCMDVAWHLQAAGSLPLDASVLAVSQWAGRGQLGRGWISPSGNLYGAWRLPGGEADGPALPVILGYAILTALQKLGVEAELKWPNDVLVAGRKVAGVLCEQRGPCVVAGIGVNLVSCPGPEWLRDGQSLLATVLADHRVEVSPLALWRRVLAAARVWLASEMEGQVMDRIEAHLAYRGLRVRVQPWSAEPFVARVSGLDPAGALRVEGPDGERRVISASIAAVD